jgi:hypothetical protein
MKTLGTAPIAAPVRGMGTATRGGHPARHGLALAGVLILAALARPAIAAEPLSPDQLDRITAGHVTATASAMARALPPAARTETATATFARTGRIPSITLRRVSDGLVVAEQVEEREAEIAFASARADANGTNPSAECTARIAFSGQPGLRLVETQRVSQPSRASCLCATFGVFVRPN